MIKKLEQLLIVNWDKLGIRQKPEKPKQLSFLVNFLQHCILIFNNRNSFPICVVKLYKGKEKYIAEYEYKNLTYVYNTASSLLKTSMPRPILLENVDEYLILLETAMQGRRVSEVIESHKSFFSKKKFVKYLQIVEDWLKLFQKDTQITEVIFTQKELEKYLLRPIRVFCEKNYITESEKRYFDEYIKKIKSILGCKFPLVSNHGDFWIGNILFENDRMGVIDWADLTKVELPFWDLFTFISSFRLKEDLKNVLDSVNFSLFKRNWFSSLIREFTLSYCSKMHIDSKIIKLFYPIFLIKNHLFTQIDCSKRNQFWRQQLQSYILNQNSFIL